MLTSEAQVDEIAIRWLIERWAVWRDGGDWDLFATLWHPNARMVATFFDGSADAFVAVCRSGWERGLNIAHHLGGSAVEIREDRAIAQTRMTIVQRAVVHNVLADAIVSVRSVPQGGRSRVLCRQAALASRSACRAAFQFQGSSSSMRLAG